MFSINLLTTLLLSISYQSAIAQNTSSSSSSSIAALASGLSTSCQTAASSLLTSDFGSCANVIGLASVISGNGSIISPVNSWISSICSADPCSNSTLSSAQQTISSGCSSDVQKGSSIASGLNTIISNYTSVRNMLCTQYSANSTFCVPSILENVQTASGQNVTLTTVTSILSNGFSAATFSNVSPGTYCNDCGHAIVTLSAPLYASANSSMTSSMASGNSSMSHNSSSVSDSIAGVCGASFSDGKVPSSVKIAAKGSSAAANNAQNSAGARESVSFSTALLFTVASSLFYFAC